MPPEPHEDFFAAQRRNRRATWRISALCAVAIAIAGIPLTLIITPLLYGVFLAGAGLVNYFAPLSPAFWDRADEIAHIANIAGDFLFNHKPADPRLLAIAAILFLGPGMLLAILLWVAVYAVLKRGGVGGALMTLGARAPNRSDPRELQLDDVVSEMALAARMQPLPRVLLIDDAGANAAAIGASAADAYLVVSRGLIDGLRREEMQGAIGHLIASIGNGDLLIAFRITSVFETMGLLVTILNAPFGPHARATLGRIVRFALRRDRTKGHAEAEAIAELLAAGTSADENDITRFFNRPSRGIVRKALSAILFPIFFTNAAIQIALWFLSGAMLAPAFAMLWRTRKYLADATSVQLTRNPDALASALVSLGEMDGAVGAASATPFLFIISPGQAHRFSRQIRADQLAAAARAWATIDDAAPVGVDLGRDNFASIKAQVTATRIAAMRGDPEAIARLAKFARAMAAMRMESVGRKSDESPAPQASAPIIESWLSFHPSIRRRLARLRRMGARIEDRSKPMSRTVEIILSVVLGPLILLLVALFILLIAMMIMLNLVFLSLWFAVIHLIFTLAIHH